MDGFNNCAGADGCMYRDIEEVQLWMLCLQECTHGMDASSIGQQLALVGAAEVGLSRNAAQCSAAVAVLYLQGAIGMLGLQPASKTQV